MPSRKAPTSTALAPWEAEMAAAAQRQAKSEKPVSGLRGISTRGGILSIDEQPVPGNEMDVVVLLSVHENQYFTGVFNPNVAQIPSCYSFGDPNADDPEDGMAPHEKSEEPQGDDNGLCANCWANVMGSAETGTGKACKNVRRLGLLSANSIETAEDIAAAEVHVIKVPVMSVKGWALYVRNTLGDLAKPTWGVVTKIKLVPDPKSQFRVIFSFVELVEFTAETYAAMKKKVAEVTPQMTAPYVKMETAAPPPPQRGRAAPAQPLRPIGRAAQAMAKAAPAKAAPAKAAPAKKAPPAPPPAPAKKTRR